MRHTRGSWISWIRTREPKSNESGFEADIVRPEKPNEVIILALIMLVCAMHGAKSKDLGHLKGTKQHQAPRGPFLVPLTPSWLRIGVTVRAE